MDASAEIKVDEKYGYSFSADDWIILNASSTNADADGNDASVLAGFFFAYGIANDGGALGIGSLHSGYLYANFNSGIRYSGVSKLIFETLEEVQGYATQWLCFYNH
ncbi:MAG: hypothetical protein V7752_07690 [Halopseudomonas sp.]